MKRRENLSRPNRMLPLKNKTCPPKIITSNYIFLVSNSISMFGVSVKISKIEIQINVLQYDTSVLIKSVSVSRNYLFNSCRKDTLYPTTFLVSKFNSCAVIYKGKSHIKEE